MNRWLLRLPLLAALAALAFLLWQWCFPSPEKLIRRRLANLAQAASYGPNQGRLATLLSVNKLLGFFTDDAEVSLEAGELDRTLTGRDQLREAALAAHSTFTSLNVAFQHLHLAVAPDRLSAQVDLLASVKVPTDPDQQFYELRFTFHNQDRAWLIQRIESVKTLR